MTDRLECTGLAGTNPLGFLAALGLLDVAHRAHLDPRLSWTDDVVPTAVFDGGDLAAVTDLVLADRDRWVEDSLVLNYPPDAPFPVLKPPLDGLREWIGAVAGSRSHPADLQMLRALVSEGARDGKGVSKPTHLDFTAGQQQFLVAVREIAHAVDRERVEEALIGPWRYDSDTKTMSWDGRGDRVYAVRATNPSNEKRTGVPGADWLAFLGLSFYPVAATTDWQLLTAACDTSWKVSAFRWPLWGVPASYSTTRAVVTDPAIVGLRLTASIDPGVLRARGIRRVLRAPIRRSDQGGYGSFGGAEALIEL